MVQLYLYQLFRFRRLKRDGFVRSVTSPMFSNQHTDYKLVCGTVISDSPRAFSSVSDLLQECVGDLPPGGHAGLVVTEFLGFD